MLFQDPNKQNFPSGNLIEITGLVELLQPSELTQECSYPSILLIIAYPTKRQAGLPTFPHSGVYSLYE